jgi:hypothetical protein
MAIDWLFFFEVSLAGLGTGGGYFGDHIGGDPHHRQHDIVG